MHLVIDYNDAMYVNATTVYYQKFLSKIPWNDIFYYHSVEKYYKIDSLVTSLVKMLI